MRVTKFAVELYSDMPSNDIEACRLAGDVFFVSLEKCPTLIHLMMDDGVEFAVSEVGVCISDRSYTYSIKEGDHEKDG